MTLKDEPCNTTKNKVIDTLKDHNDAIRLKSSNKRAFADYCSCAPEVWARSATMTSARRGFIANGMTDDKIKIFPVWDTMIKTIPRKLSNKDWSLSKNHDNASKSCVEKKSKDRIIEEAFDEMGFPVDLDQCGVPRDELRRTSVTHFQRARILSAEAMRKIRSDLISKFKEAQEKSIKK